MVCADQVGSHVVCRAERTRQVKALAACQCGDLIEWHERAPEHHGLADRIDSSTARPACELRVFPRCQKGMVLAGELRQLLNHDRSGWHIDANGQSLRRENNLHQALGKARLHDLFKGRNHASVMGGDTIFETCGKS